MNFFCVSCSQKWKSKTCVVGGVGEIFIIHFWWECKFKQVLECLIVIHIKTYDILPFDSEIPLIELYPAGIYTNIFFPILVLEEKN